MQILKGVFITGEKFQYRFISETADYFRVQKRNDIANTTELPIKATLLSYLRKNASNQ